MKRPKTPSSPPIVYEAVSLWGEPLPTSPTEPPPSRKATPKKPDPNVNPCLALYGPGPMGHYCRYCQHLLRVRHHDQTYRKCELRTLTHGAGSDHKASWPACAKWEAMSVEGPREVRTE